MRMGPDNIPAEMEGDFDPEEGFEFDTTLEEMAGAVLGQVQTDREAGA